MFKSLLFLSLVLISTLSSAKVESTCSNWQKEDGVTCIFAGRDASSYTRQCSDPCRVVIYGHPKNDPNCKREQVCHFDDPSTFIGNCSSWTRVDSVTCYNADSGTWEQQWARACTVGFKDTACSSEMPQD